MDLCILILLRVSLAVEVENPTTGALTCTRFSYHTHPDHVCLGQSIFPLCSHHICPDVLCCGFPGLLLQVPLQGTNRKERTGPLLFPVRPACHWGREGTPSTLRMEPSRVQSAGCSWGTKKMGSPSVLNMEREPRDQSVLPGVVPVLGTALGQRASQGSVVGPAIVTQIPPQ